MRFAIKKNTILMSHLRRLLLLLNQPPPFFSSLPFFLATLICTLDVIAADNSGKKPKILLAGIFFALTLLSHHLSAYILTLLLAIIIFNLMFEREYLKDKMDEANWLIKAIDERRSAQKCRNL